MKPVLTQREKVLLGILAVLAVAGLYILAFANPMSDRMEACKINIRTTEDSLVLADAKVAKMKQMEAELEKIFANGADVKELPAYDNGRNVIHGLNAILASTLEYDLTFSTADDTQESVVRRDVAMSYTCAQYEQAKNILEQIHNGDYRCLLEGLTMTYDPDAGYSVDADITYFEYR